VCCWRCGLGQPAGGSPLVVGDVAASDSSGNPLLDRLDSGDDFSSEGVPGQARAAGDDGD
jgi:hypothetical protein